MISSSFPLVRRARISATVCSLIAMFWACPAGRADAGSGDELKLAIVLTRHGVRAPLSTNEAMASLASQPWPKWEVAPSIQTPHGNLLIAYMGDYYRTRFLASGLLSGDPAKDGPLVFVRADNDQRTIETGRILGKALVQAGDPDVHALPEGTVDPLFRAMGAHVGHPDPAVAVAAVLGRMGGDPKNVERAYATQLGELKAILYGQGGPPAGSPFDEPSTVTGKLGDPLVRVTGPLLAAEHCTDSFILEYADGKPTAEVGWGKVDGKVMTDLLSLHELYFDLVCRTFYLAQVEGSNMASHIIDTLEQAAVGQPVPGALGPAGEKIVIIAGHDSTIANIGGLLDLNWWAPGTQMNPMLPGGGMVFELWRRAGSQDSFYVRISYVTQTLDQMRDGGPLSPDNPPALCPIFIPGCSGPGPGFDAPLAGFVRQARKVIDPSFIVPDSFVSPEP
jgi:4-phytase/acid phosphatase